MALTAVVALNVIKEKGVKDMFQLDFKSHKSIYEQVIDNIKELIMTDVLPEDSKLPSVRELSKELTVNPNTVQKAFRDLEREGYVYTITGKGTFVSGKGDITADPAKVEEIKVQVAECYMELLYLGLDPDKARSTVIDAVDNKGKEREE